MARLAEDLLGCLFSEKTVNTRRNGLDIYKESRQEMFLAATLCLIDPCFVTRKNTEESPQISLPIPCTKRFPHPNPHAEFQQKAFWGQAEEVRQNAQRNFIHW